MYEWDQAKYEHNLAKHGIPFDLVPLLFSAISDEVEDIPSPYGEIRRITYGYINDRLYVCVWTPRLNIRRIISLRKANKRETTQHG